MGYLSRKPTDNEIPRSQTKNPWLTHNQDMDEVALLLNGLAKKCKGCGRVINNCYLDDNFHCPDCR